MYIISLSTEVVMDSKTQFFFHIDDLDVSLFLKQYRVLELVSMQVKVKVIMTWGV